MYLVIVDCVVVREWIRAVWEQRGLEPRTEELHPWHLTQIYESKRSQMKGFVMVPLRPNFLEELDREYEQQPARLIVPI